MNSKDMDRGIKYALKFNLIVKFLLSLEIINTLLIAIDHTKMMPNFIDLWAIPIMAKKVLSVIFEFNLISQGKQYD